jgi:methyl-accepting chemotaxis protein
MNEFRQEDEFRQKVLQAEVAIRQLASELARAQGIADSVEEVRQRLNEAANILEQSREAMEEVQTPLKEAVDILRYGGEQLSRSAQDLSSKVTQMVNDFGDRIQQIQQNLQQIIAAQDTAVKRLSKLLIFCLISSIGAIIIGIAILALLFIRTQ